MVSSSSTETELTARVKGCISMPWLRKVLNKLETSQVIALTAQDNTGAIGWAEGG